MKSDGCYLKEANTQFSNIVLILATYPCLQLSHANLDYNKSGQMANAGSLKDSSFFCNIHNFSEKDFYCNGYFSAVNVVHSYSALSRKKYRLSKRFIVKTWHQRLSCFRVCWPSCTCYGLCESASKLQSSDRHISLVWFFSSCFTLVLIFDIV